MEIKFTVTQKQRLVELNVDEKLLEKKFSSAEERNIFFKEKESCLIHNNKNNLARLLNDCHLPLLSLVENRISRWLIDDLGFTKVNTPIIISETMLEKMGITDEHPLWEQVFRVNKRKYLRPMLAPNLYEVMKSLHRITREPVRIFEVGPCFRKESQGAQHLNEFTMLNLVEFAHNYDGSQIARLNELAAGVMRVVGIDDYEMFSTDSEVYGTTVDVVKNEMELGSGAYGPHPLDVRWGIFDTSWVGIGFGLERIAMTIGGFSSIKSIGRSITFLDGNRLNI